MRPIDEGKSETSVFCSRTLWGKLRNERNIVVVRKNFHWFHMCYLEVGKKQQETSSAKFKLMVIILNRTTYFDKHVIALNYMQSNRNIRLFNIFPLICICAIFSSSGSYKEYNVPEIWSNWVKSVMNMSVATLQKCQFAFFLQL